MDSNGWALLLAFYSLIILLSSIRSTRPSQPGTAGSISALLASKDHVAEVALHRAKVASVGTAMIDLKKTCDAIVVGSGLPEESLQKNLPRLN
jgi:hypothetical protein